MNQLFHSYVANVGPIERRSHGAIVSVADGVTTAYALYDIQSRGTLFVIPGTPVYAGMVIGEHSKEHDIEVNPTRAKALSNVRAAAKDDKKHLQPAKIMSLEDLISYVREDEVIEVTATAVRLRKRILDSNARKNARRHGAP